MLSRFIEQLNSDLRLDPPIQGAVDGSYHLSFAPNVEIHLREIPNSGITFHAILAPMPEKQKEECLLKVMSAHLFGKETGGFVFGLDEERKNLLLCHVHFPMDNYGIFRDRLEDFTNYAECWSEEIRESKDGPWYCNPSESLPKTSANA